MNSFFRTGVNTEIFVFHMFPVSSYENSNEHQLFYLFHTL